MDFNFINQINTIIKLYKKHAELTGEDFNVFSIMNMESDEVKTHSAIIGELLNIKGSHGLGREPLNLFISQISEKVENQSFDINNAKCHKEFYIGKINKESDYGGRIDLIVVDQNKNGFVIENKIYAGEQKRQLYRYKSAYPKAKIIFLTLSGHESESEEEIEYTSISYKEDILKWIESCSQIAYDKPLVRETLNQYAYLIKKLTNQSTNKEMSDEIVKIITENFEASSEIYKNFERALKQRQIEFLKTVKDKISKELTDWEIVLKNFDEKSKCIELTKNDLLIRYRIKTQKHSAFGIKGIDSLSDELKQEGFSENKKNNKEDNPIYWVVIENDIAISKMINYENKANELAEKLKRITVILEQYPNEN